MLLPFGPNGSKLDILEIPPFGIKKILMLVHVFGGKSYLLPHSFALGLDGLWEMGLLLTSGMTVGWTTAP